MQIVICLYGNSFSSNFLLSWSMLLDSCYKKNISIVVVPGTKLNDSLPRSKSLGYSVLAGTDQLPFQGKVEYDYLMFLNSDVLFKPDDFFSLLESSHDVTSGLYMMDDNKNFSVFTKWDTQYFLKNGCFEYLSPKALDEFKTVSVTKYMPAVFTGLGFTLMKKGVLEKLKYPVFWADLQTLVNSDVPQTDSKSTSDQKHVVEVPTEEVALFLNLQNAGFTPYVDTSVRVGRENLVIL